MKGHWFQIISIDGRRNCLSPPSCLTVLCAIVNYFLSRALLLIRWMNYFYSDEGIRLFFSGKTKLIRKTCTVMQITWTRSRTIQYVLIRPGRLIGPKKRDIHHPSGQQMVSVQPYDRYEQSEFTSIQTLPRERVGCEHMRSNRWSMLIGNQINRLSITCP